MAWNAQLVEDEVKLVHEGDVGIALGIFFDGLGSLGDADAAGRVGAGGDDLGLEGIDDGADRVGWMSSHAMALWLSVLAYAAARRYAHDPRFAFGIWKIEILVG